MPESEKDFFDYKSEVFIDAVKMNDWFPDYLFGVIDVPGSLPQLVQQRLFRQFGEGDPVTQIQVVRDSLMLFEDDHRANLASYFCGFPDEILELQALTDVQESISTLDALLPPAKVSNRIIRTKKESNVTSIAKGKIKKTATPITSDDSYSTARIESVELAYQRSLTREEAAALTGAAVSAIWTAEAICAQADPEAFFPEKGGSTRAAKTVCRICEVRVECLAEALENDERFGIWGGFSERERRKIKGTIGKRAYSEVAEQAVQASRAKIPKKPMSKKSA